MKHLNEKEIFLASDFLKLLSEMMGNCACNDWEFPFDWSECEKKQFVKGYHEWNGDPEEYDDNFLSLPDTNLSAK
jgi:hypothetical protein